MTSLSEHEFVLSDYQWKNRIVLIFAPSQRSSDYQQQIQAFQLDEEEMRDRALICVEILATGESRADGNPITSTTADALRQQFGVLAQEFAVVLVGKDGTEKQRSQTPIDLAMLFSTIDAMPMRQQEMRSRS